MEFKKLLFSGILYIILLLAISPKAYAVSEPQFPTCVNPQGIIKVSYDSGVHGIVGSTATYSGKDTVYTLPDDNLMQCFCSTDGHGIQTNWWRSSSITQAERDQLIASGWIYVPSGLPWGLTDDPYFAKNTEFSCNAQSGGGSGGGSSSSSSSSSSVNGASTVIGQVLGLASTGNMMFIASVFALGALSVLAGSLLAFVRRNK